MSPATGGFSAETGLRKGVESMDNSLWRNGVRVVTGLLSLGWMTTQAATLAQALLVQPRTIWRLDFENASLKELRTNGLDTGKLAVTLVRSEEGRGTCLRVETPRPADFCGVRVRRPIVVEKNLILAFDHREEIEAGHRGAYLGIALYCKGKEAVWRSESFRPEWRHVEIVLPRVSLRKQFSGTMHAGLTFDSVYLYARVKDRKVRGDNPARMKLFLDNVRLYVGTPGPGGRVPKPYACGNNPPLFDWRGPSAPGTRFQYSQDPGFPSERTVTITLTTEMPFYVPDKPLAGPGTWYFRREVREPLYSGWGPTAAAVIPQDALHYRLPKIGYEALAHSHRPRLLCRVRPDARISTA